MNAFSALTQRVLEACSDLAQMSEEPGRTTRTFLAPSMHRVHRYLRNWMERLGLEVWLDAIGNCRGLYGNPVAPRLLIGSHLDTVPDAGAYDGVLGVVLGIALIEALEGRPLPFAIEVAGFSEEEGVRFKTPFLGSRAMAGSFDPKLLELTDANGISVAGAIRDFGLNPEQIPLARARAEYLGYLEFHIEQGPVLEAEGLPLAVVEAIAGQYRGELGFEGKSSHAGCTPMRLRRDALTGAARFILAADQKARNTPGLLATVGQIQVLPGAVNVIPGEVRLSLDLRHARDEVRHQALRELLDQAQNIASKWGLEASWSERMDQPAVPMDAGFRGLLAEAMREEGYPEFETVSGAGHDAQIMAEQMPAAMLFLRSPGGLSHHPQEAVLAEDVAAALRVGLRFVKLLAAQR